MDRNTVLEVQGLSVGFGSGSRSTTVVRDLSFSIKRGEVMALVGESGCGKSATCLAIGGLQPPGARVSAKSLLFRGKDDMLVDLLANGYGDGIRGGEIAYVFQEPSVALNPVFSIERQIDEVLRLHRLEVSDRHKEIVKLLAEVGIPDPEKRMKAFPHELSGGMQQRAMIAMALAGCPQLLIADEPTTALDVTIQAQILELLSDLRNRSGMSVLIVTHNLGVVSRIADRVAVMYAGDIVECGPTRQVIDSPVHPYTRALVAAVPRLGTKVDRLTSIPGMVPSADKFGRGCRFFDRCALAAELDDAGRERCRDTVPEEKRGDGVSCRCHLVEQEEDR